MSVTFTEKQLDGAALLAAAGAIGDLPDKFISFLTNSQIGALQEDIRAAVKTSLLFSLMNHLDDESFSDFDR